MRIRDGRVGGMAGFCGYTGNENEMVSLAVVDADHAAVGSQVILVWGEPDGGSRKPQVERHRQFEVRATVAPAPYAEAVRRMKAEGIGKAA